MIFSFIAAMARRQYAKWRGYKVLAEPFAQEIRHRICERCEFFDDGQCRICKCLTMAKVMLATEQCPERKWLRIWEKRSYK